MLKIFKFLKVMLLLSALTVRFSLAGIGATKKLFIKENLSNFRESANDLGLGSEWDKKTLNVEASGGEKKKNELIQLDMLDPQTAILDEPDSGLDIDAIKVLVEKLRAFVNKGDKTLIIVSHYAELITKLNPDTLTILDKQGNAKQTEDIHIAYDILENGCKR